MSEEILDEERLNELIALDDPELLNELVTIYFRESEIGISDMHNAITARNADQLHAYAHKLKGGSSSLGVKKVQMLAFQLETNGKNNVFEGAMETLEQLRTEYFKAKELLTERFLKG